MTTVVGACAVLAPSGVTRTKNGSRPAFAGFSSYTGFRRLNTVDQTGGASSSRPQTLHEAFRKSLRRPRRRNARGLHVTRAMFERFTEKAIKVVMLAQEEARRLGHNFVGTEQILLGLIGESTGVPLWVLRLCWLSVIMP